MALEKFSIEESHLGETFPVGSVHLSIFNEDEFALPYSIQTTFIAVVLSVVSYTFIALSFDAQIHKYVYCTKSY